MKTILKTLLLAGAAAALATGANAATVFNFGLIADTTPLTTGDLGATATYTISGLSVFAAAFGPNNTNGTPDHLYGKNLAGDEIGLGMTNDPSGEHEIYFGKGFIQLSFSNNANKNAIFVAFNSTTGGEQWKIVGGNSAGVLNTNVINAGGTSEGANVQLTGGYQYYDIISNVSAGGKNVLLNSATLSAAPEPATWALMIVGFGGIGAAVRRRRTEVAATT